MGKSYSDKVKGRGKKRSSGKSRRRSGSRKQEEKVKFPVAPVVVIGIVVALIILAAVLYQFNNSDEEGGTGSINNGENNDPGTGPAYLGIGLESTSNGIIHLEDHKGKVVVLDMFATWCGPCKTQIVELGKLDARYGASDLVILSVDVDQRESLGQVSDFKREHGAGWDFAMSNDAFTGHFPATSIPTLYILDRDGNLVDKHVGLIDANELENEIKQYI
ncbi:MAG: TlpA disulfide reductase family protein [Candidatus Thermoplasmatota archaeon]|nr:TlpA disulfide reductase family protein [Candidatus Thermoplasmatota archaeon]